MYVKKLLPLLLAVLLAAGTLTGCNWWQDEDGEDSSSSSSSSSSAGQDNDGDESGSDDPPAPEPVVYTVAASIGEGGTVTIDGTAVKDGESASLPEGTTIAFSVTPNEGYEIYSVTAGGKILTGTDGRYTYTVSGNCTIAVTFKVKTYTVTLSINGGSGDAKLSTQTVEHGQSVTVTVTPAAGYEVDSVKAGDIELKAEDEKTYVLSGVTADQEITVTFKAQRYTVTASVSGSGGTVSPDKQTVAHGEDATVTVNPDDGYKVESVKAGDIELKAEDEKTYVLSGVTADQAVIVTFVAMTIEEKFEKLFYDGNGPKGTPSVLKTYMIDNGTLSDIEAMLREISGNDAYTLPTTDGRLDKISDNLTVSVYMQVPVTVVVIYYAVDDNSFFIYCGDEEYNYPNFSTIYPGT